MILTGFFPVRSCAERFLITLVNAGWQVKSMYKEDPYLQNGYSVNITIELVPNVAIDGAQATQGISALLKEHSIPCYGFTILSYNPTTFCSSSGFMPELKKEPLPAGPYRTNAL